MNSQVKPITDYENKLSKGLAPIRAKEFIYSRGYVREVLSNILGIPPLSIPLEAPPGKPPKLKEGLGSITFSHCIDALFIGWSDKKLGIDIERKDRKFNPNSLIERFYFEKEKKELKLIFGDELRINTLKLWVLKEAAIKWQNGSIASDLNKWLIRNNCKEAHHEELNISLNTYYFDYKSWYLGIANNSDDIEIKPIIHNI